MAESTTPSNGTAVPPPPTTSTPTPEPRRHIPLVCHGHTRPVTHLCFSTMKSGHFNIVSGSKDSIPILRDGKTGDWMGSWIGHQGAIWCARQSNDWSRAASASADFTARIWDASTGEPLYTLTHKHVVRALDFCPSSNDMVITASNDGVLRLWMLSKIGTPTSDAPDGIRTPVEGHYDKGNNDYVWTVGKHLPNKAIKYVVWLGYPERAPPGMANLAGAIVTAQNKTLYWWQVSKMGAPGNDDTKPWKEHTFKDDITCCERFTLDPDTAEAIDVGGGLQVLGVAAGKTAAFWGGPNCDQLLKQFDMDWRVSSVAVDVKNRKVLMGQADSTWGVMIDWETGAEEQVFKAHHGAIHSMSFSPDNNIFATGSEDGTIRIWKNCEGDYGLWKVVKKAAEPSS